MEIVEAQKPKDIWLYDIETLFPQFLLGMKLLGEEHWKWFEISAYRNDVDSMVKMLKETNIIACGFNNLTFDSQVVQYILETAEMWYDLTGPEIVQLIYRFSQELIDNQKYEVRKLPYNESYMDVEQWDLFSILGYENKHKRTSLKWIEFALDMPIKEMPYPHTIKFLTEQQCQEVREYCESDIRTTEMLYYLVRGQTDNEFYREKDEVQYRLDTIKEVGLPKRAVNYSGVRLGEEIVLKGYMKESGMNMGKLWEKKKKVKVRTKFKFGECIPSYVKFKTKPFQEFYERVRKEDADIWDKEQEFPLSCNGTHYLIKKGGIHSKDGARIVKSGHDPGTGLNMLLKDADIGLKIILWPN